MRFPPTDRLRGPNRIVDEGVQGRRGLYDYETAWKWAMSIGKEERASRFAEIVKANRR
jgi:hypothetical protein